MIGFINVNKPAGLTSAQVVSRVKHALKLDKHTKIGHMGTLDKLASGVLPLAIGRATRLFDYMLSKKKYYRAEFTFGSMTDTLDLDGKVIQTTSKYPTKSEIEAVLPQFLGKLSQLPPMFSAKSINGVRASDLARQGKTPGLKPAEIEIFDLRLVEYVGNSAVIDIECSAGTYIRSLCRDLATALDSCATMTKLIRTRAGVFTLDMAVELDEVSDKTLLPADIVLGGVERLALNGKDELNLLFQGKKLTIKKPAGLYACFCDDELKGLLEIDEQNKANMKTWLIVIQEKGEV